MHSFSLPNENSFVRNIRSEGDSLNEKSYQRVCLSLCVCARIAKKTWLLFVLTNLSHYLWWVSREYFASNRELHNLSIVCHSASASIATTSKPLASSHPEPSTVITPWLVGSMVVQLESTPSITWMLTHASLAQVMVDHLVGHRSQAFD